MTYQLLWRRRHLADIARWFTEALEHGRDPGALTLAVNRIEQALTINPLGAGESREDERRIIVYPPLAVDFEVFEEAKTVYILGIRYLP